ncbi:HDIG domain-containing protein [Desulfatibacillum alkenivorans DSM 16219]|jgi:putative nucleotidyltransferase with HDIG domain|uniref:HDIG domain-containing protein n=1 Tax=Desulfatibacillum alkenivorans DSM 16219 TaxID=1121393 RepID=A0A1M6J328_9BACT|nr:HD domain-containing phosphohydrolase [Desulfatibacillum alkenivorans]SHJ41069.1 HDIG domain-containing protein [Desulfatibacillum alkenivorans DSM 16219]
MNMNYTGMQTSQLDQMVSSFVSSITASIRNSLIYDPNHSQVQFSITQAQEKASGIFQSLPEMVFVCIEKEILFAGKPMNKKGLHFVKLAEFMQTVGVQRLVFLPGLNADEIREFVHNATAPPPEGEDEAPINLNSTRCVRVGRLVTEARAGSKPRVSHKALVNLMVQGTLSQEEIAELEAKGQQTPGEELRELDVNFLEQARDAISQICNGSGLHKAKIRNSVMSFIHYFLKYADDLLPLKTLKDHDPLTFNHSLNVSVLCAAQAQFLDASPEVFRDAALAGLYHDFGKLRIPAKVLNKAEPLSAQEKMMIAQHCLAGARILAKNRDLPRVAAIAAYEHHLHYSGKAGYPRSTRVQTPMAISQMVTLADFYDAALTDKPYRPARSIGFVLDLLQKRSGAQFDPYLVNIFSKVIHAFAR